MAIEAQASDFDEDAPDTGNPLVAHNAVARDNLSLIVAIKEALLAEDYVDAVELWYSTPDHVKHALWVAPSRGGLFTTKEREILKSDELARIRDGKEAGEFNPREGQEANKIRS
jgi:hypothetical protein